MKPKLLLYSTLILGWLISLLLLIQFHYHNSNITSPFIPEFIYALDLGVACQSMLLNPYAKILDIPWAGLGIVYFSLLAIFLSIENNVFTNIATILVAIGGGISLALCLSFRYSIVPNCSYCYFVHLLNFMLLFILWKQKFHMKKLNWILGFALILSFLGSFSLIIAGPLGKQVTEHQELISDFEVKKALDIPIHKSPIMGIPQAPIQLVVFSSLQCLGCQQFNKTLQLLALSFPKELQIIFKHYPLSNLCNSNVSSDMQTNSCSAAQAAEAAHQMGKFWEFHDAVFAGSLNCDEKELLEVAEKIGLPIQQWDALRQDSTISQRIIDDTRLGGLLEITATPSIFINGKKANQNSFTSLFQIITNELKNQ